MRRLASSIAFSAVGLVLGCTSEEPGPGIAPKPTVEPTASPAPDTGKSPRTKKLLLNNTGENTVTPQTK